MLVIVYTASAVVWWRHLVDACVLKKMGRDIPLGYIQHRGFFCARLALYARNTKNSKMTTLGSR